MDPLVPLQALQTGGWVQLFLWWWKDLKKWIMMLPAVLQCYTENSQF